MVLLELVTQGVRGFAPNARTAFDPGYAEIPAVPEGAPSVARLLTAAVYGERDEDGTFDIAADPARRAKLALTLQGNDGVTYRVVRELGGTCVLHRLNATSHRFEAVAQDPDEVAQGLSDVGLPPREAWERLCVLAPAQLPSKRAGSRGSDRLRALVRELELAREVESLQAKQDELVAELYPVESQLRVLDGLRAAIDEAERAWANAPSPEELGVAPDIVERLTKYPEVVQRRAAALEKLAADREAMESAYAPPPAPPVPLYRDVRFLAGAGLGTACLVGAAFLEGSARYLALLDVPSFGAAALVAVQYVDGLRDSGRGTRTVDRFGAREKRIEGEFEADAAPVRAALKALSVETPEEALNVLGQKALLAERLEDLRRQLAKAEGDPSTSAAARQHAMLKARADQVAAKLEQRAPGYVRHSRDVEADLHAVQEAEAQTRARTQVKVEDPAPELLRDVCDWTRAKIPDVGADVAERCSRYVSALTAKRYVGVQFDAKGGAVLVAEGGRVKAGDLSPQDADLFWVALRLTIAEKWVSEARAPVFVEELGAVVGVERQPLLARMLKHLGATTQVLSA